MALQKKINYFTLALDKCSKIKAELQRQEALDIMITSRSTQCCKETLRWLLFALPTWQVRQSVTFNANILVASMQRFIPLQTNNIISFC